MVSLHDDDFDVLLSFNAVLAKRLMQTELKLDAKRLCEAAHKSFKSVMAMSLDSDCRLVKSTAQVMRCHDSRRTT